jgi:neutral amino acid transport system permease protein
MTELVQFLLNGLMLGSIIGLTAMGLTLVYGILNLANFAHGDYLTLGAYFAFFFSISLGLNIFLAFIAAVAASSLVGVIIDKIIWKPMRTREATLITLLITSIGVAFVLRNLIILIWGNAIQNYGYEIKEGMSFYGAKITETQVWIIISAVLIMFMVHFLLTYSKLGKAMRATSDNIVLAEICGIDVERVITWTWVIAAALAAVGGIMLGMDTHIKPVMGWGLLLPIFAAVILGGIGNPYGAVSGGMVIGLSQELSVAIIPSHYKPAVSFGIMIMVLLIRPQGIFRGR